MGTRDNVWKAGKTPAKPKQAPAPKVRSGIKVRTGLHTGGIDPGGNSTRNLSALLEKEDRAIRRRERTISRELKRLGRGR